MITLDEIEYDHQKNLRNFEKHGIYLTEAVNFDWETALCWPDKRMNYFEVRQICIGLIKQRLHVIVYTNRFGKLRIISLRKANKREIIDYAKNYQHS